MQSAGAGCRADCVCSGRGECNADDSKCVCSSHFVGDLCELVPVSHYCSKTTTGLPCLAGTFEIGRGLDATTGMSKLPVKAFSFSGLTDPRIRFEIPGLFDARERARARAHTHTQIRTLSRIQDKLLPDV